MISINHYFTPCTLVQLILKKLMFAFIPAYDFELISITPADTNNLINDSSITDLEIISGVVTIQSLSMFYFNVCNTHTLSFLNHSAFFLQ